MSGADRLEPERGDQAKDARELENQIIELEDEVTNLANFYALVQRLYSATDRSDTFAAIHEIAANLIGCEHVAVFEVSHDGRSLELAFGHGVAEDPLRTIEVGEGLIGLAVRRGEVVLAKEAESRRASPPYEASVTACIPMLLGGRAAGVVALFELLPHKGGFGAFDPPIFDALKAHAGLALHIATTFPRVRPQAGG